MYVCMKVPGIHTSAFQVEQFEFLHLLGGLPAFSNKDVHAMCLSLACSLLISQMRLTFALHAPQMRLTCALY